MNWLLKSHLIRYSIILALLLLVTISTYSADKDFYERSRIVSNPSTAASDPVIDPFINWPLFYAVQQTGMINASFDCSGRFGFTESNSSTDPWSNLVTKKFVSPAGSEKEYLFGGSIWVGTVIGRDTLVSTAFDGWSSAYEFNPPQYPDSGSIYKFNSFTDFSMTSICTDTFPAAIDYSGRPHIPLNIEVNNRGHVFRRDTLENVIFYDILLTNFGIAPLEQTYIGFYYDCDIGDRSTPNAGIAHTDDFSGSIREHGIGYSIDNDGDPTQVGPIKEFDSTSVRKIFASKVIGCSEPILNTNYNWWVSDNNSNYDFGPRMRGTVVDPFRDFGTGGLGTPEGDANKYYMLRHNEWDYDVFRIGTIGPNDPIWIEPNLGLAQEWANGHDTRFLMSYGPFDIMPGSSVRIILINFTADSVHLDPYNISNLPFDPDTYYNNLLFDGLLTNLSAAENMVDSFFNPLQAVPGVRTTFSSTDSVVVEWDQWVAPEGQDIEGFDLFLSEADTSLFPYPGIVPPWLMPDELNLFQSLGKVTKSTFTTLDSDKYYLLNIAHRTNTGLGEEGKPISITQKSRNNVSTFEHEYVFYYTDSSATIEWNPPENIIIDHFNVYKFESLEQYNKRYHPFYHEGYNSDILEPIDSFNIDGKLYFYFEMEKYGVVDAVNLSFTDLYPDENSFYSVTAVDESGYEHDFSQPVEAIEISPIEKDVLVFINSYPSTQPYMTSTAFKKNFYQSILADYTYDIYSLFDSMTIADCTDNPSLLNDPCYDLIDLSKYQTIIIDDDWKDIIIHLQSEPFLKYFSKFILNGGKLITFGSFAGMERDQTYTDITKEVTSDFVDRFFGIVSISYYNFLHNIGSTVPGIDSLFAFSYADPVDFLSPTLHLDTTVDFLSGFTGPWEPLWPENSPPNVATFELDDRGELMYRFRSQFPQSSTFEDLPIGVKTITDISKTYLFGFHLYYMKQNEARQLVDYIIKDVAASAQPVAIADPSLIYTFWANSIETLDLSVQFGQLTERHVSDVDFSTLIVNSNIQSSSVLVTSAPTGYFGDFIELQLPMRDFILGYGILHDVVDTTFNVSGNFLDGEPFEIVGDVTFRAHVFGDMNDDKTTDITDLVMFVNYMYLDGESPVPLSRADLNNDGIVDITDLVKLIQYMFNL